jgi:two-component system, OmpR family, phosphate regulon sensor histidine kinase PhoR
MSQRHDNQPTFEDLELLAEVSQLLTLTDLDRVLNRVIDLVSRAVKASKTSLFLLEGAEVDWDYIFTKRDLDKDKSVRVVSKVLEDGFAGWVSRYRRGDIITDTYEDDRWITFPDDPIDTRSVVCVPFLHQGNVIAIVTLEHEAPNHFKPYHLRLMQIIANQATISIRNAQLFNNLNTQRRQLSAVLQSMQDVLLALSEEGNIKLVNPAAIPLLDTGSTAMIVGRNINDFVEHDSVFEPIVEIINAGLMGNERWTFETRSDNLQVDYQVTMSIWEEVLHEKQGYVIVMHDVTQLHDLSRFKDEMLRVASHDLRSPLALIAGYTDMIALDTPDDESPVHEYVGIIKGVLDRMGGLVDDLLRVERIRSSPLELHEHTDLAALVKLVIVNMRPAAMAKDITFDNELTFDNLPRVIADPVLLRQSMENLISNAIKYTPEGGTITVRASNDKRSFYFEVEDTGIGIPDEHLAYVFESFYRVQSPAHRVKGSGLGLSLVKNVIERHQGEVDVRSRYGDGSVFSFYLPLEQKRLARELTEFQR